MTIARFKKIISKVRTYHKKIRLIQMVISNSNKIFENVQSELENETLLMSALNKFTYKVK